MLYTFWFSSNKLNEYGFVSGLRVIIGGAFVGYFYVRLGFCKARRLYGLFCFNAFLVIEGLLGQISGCRIQKQRFWQI